jgi:rRNA processing protein Gar1
VNTLNGILDLDNIIFNENKIAVGYLDDVIGKVDSPCYIIKLFPDLQPSSINLVSGKSVFFVKTKGKQITPSVLMKKRGCDASNAFDEEVAEDEIEFSDDEEEAARKAMKKNKFKEDTNSFGNLFVDNFCKPIKKQKLEVHDSQNNLYNPGLTHKVNRNNNQIGNSFYSSEYKLNNNNYTQNANYHTMNQGMNSINNMNIYQSTQNFNNMMNLMMMNNLGYNQNNLGLNQNNYTQHNQNLFSNLNFLPINPFQPPQNFSQK